MLNLVKSKNKQSNVEKKLNVVIISILILQMIICFVLAILSIQILHGDNLKFEIEMKITSTHVQGLLNFLIFFILLNTLVPISLMVSLEVVK
jgi:phospholipid-translocating ATPase